MKGDGGRNRREMIAIFFSFLAAEMMNQLLNEADALDLTSAVMQLHLSSPSKSAGVHLIQEFLQGGI